MADKRLRTATRATVTRSVNKAKEILEGDSVDTTKLRAVSNLLKTKLNDLEDLNAKIISAWEDDDESFGREIEECTGYEESIYETLAEIDEALQSVVITADEVASERSQSEYYSRDSSERSESNLNSQSTEGRAKRHIKRPTINLPTFDGNPMDYQTFIDSFTSSIDNDDDLSKIDKFTYLKGALRGKAKNAIEGLRTTAENYDEAISLLKTRFGDKKFLISTFFKAILDLNPVTDCSDISKLRDLYDAIEINVRNLKTLGITSESFAPVIIPTILSKIPEAICHEVMKINRESDWDFHAVVEKFQNEVVSREQCKLMSRNSTGSRKPDNGGRINRQRERTGDNDLSTGSSLLSTSQGGKNQRAPTCVYCGQNHKAVDCDRVPEIAKRREILQRDKRCFNCLKKNCRVFECKSPFKCNTCQQKHHSSIHGDDKGEGETTQTNIGTTRNNVVLLKTAIVDVTRSEKSANPVKVRVILDDCSQRTYITRKIREKLQLDTVDTKNSIVNGICASSTAVKSEVVTFYLHLKSRKKMKITARVLDTICAPITQPAIQDVVNTYPHLADITFADYHDGTEIEVQILIGGDFYYELVTANHRKGPPGTPTAVLTELGWMIGGPAECQERVHTNIASVCLTGAEDSENSENFEILFNLAEKLDNEGEIDGNFETSLKTGEKSEKLLTSPQNLIQIAEKSPKSASSSENLDTLVKRFWDLETIGIKDDETPHYDEFLNNIRFDSSTHKYEVQLPWKPNHKTLPENYQTALRRLMSLRASLLKRPDDLRRYHEIILDQLSKNIIEPCPVREIRGEATFHVAHHYLPHRDVKRDSETTDLRVVYDASSKPSKKENSLNDCLLKGPSLTPKLFDVIVRWRVHLVAFICDIQKAFLQINVAEKDRDVLRFLWFEDPFAENPELVSYRFTRVVFGLNCSPFLLNGTLRHHLMKNSESYKDEIEKILRCLYVDDFTGGSNTPKEAHALYQLLKRVLMDGGFPIHKFLTNNPELLKLVTEDQNLKTVKKVLGLLWDAVADEIIIDLEDAIDDSDIITKRIIASVIMKIFDPLGLIAPIIILAKCILQEAWQTKSNWDAPLPEALQRRWREWQESLKNCSKFRVPRCYVTENVAEFSLFGFCDASTKAFAAVIYLRSVSTSGHVRSMIVASKTRVAPIRITTKTVKDENPTVPKLELLSCLILSSLMNTVLNALQNDIKIKSRSYWTDSTINLDRIRGIGNEYEPFEENRLKKIRGRSEISQWFYVPTDHNPADIPSRGSLSHELQDNELWFSGPKFMLDLNSDFLAFEKELHDRTKSCDPALKRSPDLLVKGSRRSESRGKKSAAAHTMVSGEQHKKLPNNLSKLIRLDKSNDIDKLVRITAYVLRFASRQRNEGDLTTQELDNARTQLIISEQQLDQFSRGKDFVKDKANLRIFVDDKGLMRCRGRISNSELSYDTKFPIYIPKRSRLATLIVWQAHEAVFHQKERSTLTEIRNTYWIPRGRQLVRSLLHKCTLCNWLDSQAFTLPPAPPLPEYRVEIAPPFSNVGFDHMGPLWVYDVFNKVKLHKVHIAVFTCCVTRMIHLELQPSLDAPVCIRSMKRTFSRVGYAKLLISDNHKTFKSKQLQRFAANNSIEWKYILELAPHWGGFYERLNRLVKNALRKILRKSRLSYEEVETILVEIEGVLNSRPLTYVDDSDLTEPLTPSHLMYGRNILNRTSSVDKNSETPSNRIKHVNKLLDHFWKRFSSEYLCSLRERDRLQRRKNPRCKIVSVGDVVLVHQKQVARNSWPLGKITRLISSPDGEVRGAELRTATGKLNRPINLLYPLEM